MNMKFFYVIFLFLSQVTFGSEDQKRFAQANFLFEQEEYEQACKLYQSIENKGFIVLYNMSLSYAHSGDNAQAILYAQRAEKLANFEQLTLLYEYYTALKKNIDPDYEFSFHARVANFVKKCILSIPMVLLQLILLIFFILCIVLWYKREKKEYKKMLMYTLFFMMVFGFMWSCKKNYIHRSVGIVISDDVCMFSGPDASFYKKAVLQKTDEVFIIGANKKYYQVQAKNSIGWISDMSIELV